MSMHSATQFLLDTFDITASMPASRAFTCWNVTLPAVSTGAPPVVCSNWLISAASVGFCTAGHASAVRPDDLQSRSWVFGAIT
jgi:hypothetical protein